MRGPGIGKGQITPHIGLNIDLAPTFIDLAGGTVPDDMDGRSLKPVLTGNVEKVGEALSDVIVKIIIL